MNKAKKVLYTVAAGFVAGAIVGVLFAPDKGSETRRKLRALKDRFSCCETEELDDLDKETLEELAAALKEQLNKINEKLDKSA